MTQKDKDQDGAITMKGGTGWLSKTFDAEVIVFD